MIRLSNGKGLSTGSNSFVVGDPRERPGGGYNLHNPEYYPTIEEALRGAGLQSEEVARFLAWLKGGRTARKEVTV